MPINSPLLKVPILFWFLRHCKRSLNLIFLFFYRGICLHFLYVIIQHCFICRPSDSTVSEDDGFNFLLWQKTSAGVTKGDWPPSPLPPPPRPPRTMSIVHEITFYIRRLRRCKTFCKDKYTRIQNLIRSEKGDVTFDEQCHSGRPRKTYLCGWFAISKILL